MIVEYKEYEIEFSNEESYSINSVDNIRQYDVEYSSGKEVKERFHPTNKYGIIVKDKLNNEVIKSAVLCENGRATNLHEKSFFIDNYKIWICICDKIYCLNLPKLDIEWCGRYDYAANFSINSFKEDFIIHGELEVLRINRMGEIQWRFGGSDIFVLPSGESNFTIGDDKIEVQDWGGYTYIIDEHGDDMIVKS